VGRTHVTLPRQLQSVEGLSRVCQGARTLNTGHTASLGAPRSLRELGK
jgi:hypothetical protein